MKRREVIADVQIARQFATALGTFAVYSGHFKDDQPFQKPGES